MKHKYRAVKKTEYGTTIMFDVEAVDFTPNGVEIKGENKKCLLKDAIIQTFLPFYSVEKTQLAEGDILIERNDRKPFKTTKYKYIKRIGNEFLLSTLGGITINQKIQNSKFYVVGNIENELFLKALLQTELGFKLRENEINSSK